MKEEPGGTGKSQADRPGETKQSKQTGKRPDSEIGRLTAQDANRIVAEAYREAARIVDDAKQKVADIYSQAGRSDLDEYQLTGDRGVTRESYQKLDDLFVEIRYQLQDMTRHDRMTVEKLLEMVNQLEYYVDSLVIDSLKLRNIQQWLQGTTVLARRLKARLDKE